MSHAPECLKERFKAADELVQELNESKCINENCSIEEPEVKLMCQLWNILKDNPNLNLTEAVKEQTKKLQKHNLSIPLNVTNLNLACLSAGSSDTITEVCSCSSDTNSNSTPCCSHKVPREPPGPDAPPLTKAIYNINEMMILSDSSTSFSIWKDTPIPLYLECYLYHITNVEEILSGKDHKIKLEQRGPYVLREFHTKVTRVDFMATKKENIYLVKNAKD